MKKSIAAALLDINAVSLSIDNAFVWTSGLKSPIYCDNRLTLSYPNVRREIAQGLAQLITANFPDVTVIAGTATAGIPHAAWVSDILDLPMIYVRGSAKAHGKGNQIEGKIQPHEKVVIIEDLISTGKSAIQCAEVLRKKQCDVLGVVAIFDYKLAQSAENFAKHHLNYVSLSDYPTLLDVALERGLIKQDEQEHLKKWNQSPENWQ